MRIKADGITSYLLNFLWTAAGISGGQGGRPAADIYARSKSLVGFALPITPALILYNAWNYSAATDERMSPVADNQACSVLDLS